MLGRCLIYLKTMERAMLLLTTTLDSRTKGRPILGALMTMSDTILLVVTKCGITL